MFHFYIPYKNVKDNGFPAFLEGVEREHGPEMN